MTTRTCQHCENPIPRHMRADARSCSKSCREMASRARARVRRTNASAALPTALTRHSRWVRHSATKVPLTVGGSHARANDPSTWSTYEIARDSRVGAGLGFVLSGDGVICVDMDNVLINGVLSAEAASFLAKLPPTYIEISPSGTGLHVWGRGLMLTSRKFRNAGFAGEVIGSRKYATVTGNRWPGAPLTLANVAAPVSALIY